MIKTPLSKALLDKVIEALEDIRDGIDEQLLRKDDGTPFHNTEYTDYQAIVSLINEIEN